MPRRTALAASSFLTLSACYLLYAVFVTPRLTPSVTLPTRELTVQPEPPRRGRDMAVTFLPHKQWTHSAKYQLRTEDAFIFADEWERVNSERAIRFSPFAMIWHRGQEDLSDVPLTIVSTSAVLTFERSFSPSDPDAGRIVHAALEGDVRVNGPDGLAVTGRDFNFAEDSMKVWSDNGVWFRYGPHQGRAFGVDVDLIRDEMEQEKNDLAVAGIRSIRLRRNVSMQLSFEQAERKHQPVPVQVESDGSFEYVLETNVASFRDQVRVVRPTNNGFSDRLACMLLTLFFEPSTPVSDNREVSTSEQAAEESANVFRGMDSDLEFRRLRAEGDRVVLTSEENRLTAQLTRLDYDIQQKRIDMRATDAVVVNRDQSRMTAPMITLRHGEGGTVTDATCRGPGRLLHHNEQTGELELAARWQKELRKYTDPENNLDVIELREQAVLHQPLRQAGMTADLIKLWFDPQKRQGGARSGDRGYDSSRAQPKFVVALNNIAVDSPQLQVKTANRLDVHFTEMSTPAGTRVAAAPSRADMPAPAVVQQSAYYPGSEVKSAADEPLEVVCESIRMQVHTHGDQQAEVSEIWTLGNVHVRQRHEAGEEPLRLSGDQMHVENRGPEDQVLHLYGQPAHIRDRGVHIEGREVHFDRRNNNAWVTGAGLLQLPVEGRPGDKLLPANSRLDVWWTERMVFDGQAAHFLGDVKAELGDNRMTCREMEVDMLTRIDFSASQPPENAQIQNIFCRNGVDFEGYEYTANQLVELRKANVWELHLDRITGDVNATGPGWMTRWHRGQANRASLSPQASVQANQPLRPETAEWEYTRVDFAGNAAGNMEQRYMTFRERVHIAYGPVDRLLATINPDELPKNAGRMHSDSLRITYHEQSSEPADEASDAQSDYIELVAEGNARLEGRSPQAKAGTFYAQADSISYDESKEFYVLRSLGDRKATIWRETQPGGDRSFVKSQRLEFFPARNKWRAVRTTGVQGTE